MATENHSRRIAVVMPYHNNLHDFLIALSRLGSTYVITPRSFRKRTHLPPPVPTQKIYSTLHLGPIEHAYNPFRLWKMIDRTTTHVLIKHLDLLENIIPALIAQMRGARLVVMVQQVHKSFFRSLLIRCVIWYLHYTKATIFSVTTRSRDVLQPLFPHIQYIPACINPQRFTLANMHTIEPAALRIVAIGKYIKRKNFTPLVDAILLIRTQHPQVPIHLTLIGPTVESNIYDSIKERVATSSLLKNIITVLADIPPQEIPNVLASHNLFVLPAASEPLGYAVLEAMATGLPIITTHQVGSSSYVMPGKNGLLISDTQPQKIAEAIIHFIKPDQAINVSKLRQFGQNSRVLVERLYTPDAIMQKINNIFS